MSKYFKKLVGEGIYLSPWAGDDEEAELFARWVNDFQVTDGVLISHQQHSIISEQDFLRTAAGKPDGDKHNFTIIDAKTDQPIGNCSITHIDLVHRTGELGIMIGEELSRGKGFGGAALKLLLDYGFNYLGLNNICLKYVSNNIAAAKCYEKVGFKVVGNRRQAIFLNGKYYDSVEADFLADEFRAKYGDVIKNKHLGV